MQSKTRTKSARKSSLKPAWQTRWPANGDLAAWLRCGIDKCQAILQLDLRAEKIHLPIHGLAKFGQVSEALKHLEALMKQLHGKEFSSWVRAAQLGAKICLEADDSGGCQRYLQRMNEEAKKTIKKSERRSAESMVRDFRLEHGLLDPAEASSPEEKMVATYNAALRSYQSSINGADSKQVQATLDRMLSCAQAAEGWRKSRWLSQIVELANEQGNRRLIRKVMASVPEKDRQARFGFRLFAKIGMKREAKEGAVQTIQSSLAELHTMTDPNIHIPVSRIVDGLNCLIQIGEKKQASAWFKKVARSVENWKCVIQGWTTTAVLTAFVPIVELLDGAKAAQDLARLAHAHAGAEPRSAFKRGATGSAMQASASVNTLEDAIQQARQIRSPAVQRLELAKLLARGKRWKELRETCSQAASPEEAAKLALWVKFELPGGEVGASRIRV
jgi:hypothetical protein